MNVFLISVFVVTICGVVLLGAMFRKDDSRLGMAGLGVLIAADIMAMVYAALDA